MSELTLAEFPEPPDPPEWPVKRAMDILPGGEGFSVWINEESVQWAKDLQELLTAEGWEPNMDTCSILFMVAGLLYTELRQMKGVLDVTSNAPRH